MEDRMMKFYSKESNMLALHAMHGHFATSHSHINYYVDVTSIKTRVAEAKQAAHVLYSRIPKTNTWIPLCVWMERKWSVPF